MEEVKSRVALPERIANGSLRHGTENFEYECASLKFRKVLESIAFGSPKRRLQQLFLPERIAFDGIRFNRTAVTARLFNYLAPDQRARKLWWTRTASVGTTSRTGCGTSINCSTRRELNASPAGDVIRS